MQFACAGMIVLSANIRNGASMFKKIFAFTCSASLVSLLLTASAVARDLSYTNITLGYASSDIAEQGYDGYQIGGSVALTSQLFVLASTARLESEDKLDLDGSGAATRDADRIVIGVGMHTPLSETLDFVGTVSFIDAEQLQGQVLVDAEGFQLSTGVRYLASERVELIVDLAHTVLDERTGGGATLGARYYFAQAISFGAGYQHQWNGAKDDNLSVDFRFDF